MSTDKMHDSTINQDIENEYDAELEAHKKECKKNSEKHFFYLLIIVVEQMIKENHPRIKEVLSVLDNKPHHNSKDWIPAILKELDALTPSSYTRLKNQNHPLKKPTVITICYILGIALETATELLSAAGYTFRDGNNLDDCYQALIKKSHKEAENGDGGDEFRCYALIGEANRFLLRKGAQKGDLLGVQSRKEKEESK